jgi:hypothetical protein
MSLIAALAPSRPCSSCPGVVTWGGLSELPDGARTLIGSYSLFKGWLRAQGREMQFESHPGRSVFAGEGLVSL